MFYCDFHKTLQTFNHHHRPTADGFNEQLFRNLTSKRGVEVNPHQIAGPVQPRFHGGSRDSQPPRDFVARQIFDIA
jgi:hypothetical protein